MLYLLETPPSSIKDWLPLLSVCVTLALFLVDRIIAIGVRRREVRRTWYLKVLIEPNIPKISIFFDDIANAYEKATVALSGEKREVELAILKSINFEKFIDLKRQIIANLVQPLYPQYFAIAVDISSFLEKLEDRYTNNLDNGLFSVDDVNSFKLYIYTIKGELLNSLYTPLIRRKVF